MSAAVQNINNTSSRSPLLQHLVIPGQVIAISSTGGGEEESFLRGHGTHIEKTAHEQRLIASVTGIVQRVNKLISVESISSTIYEAHTGDLIVGRITVVGSNRWSVQLLGHAREAALPLSGVHLPGGVQRVRTAQDAREMRQYLAEGDLVSAEVHKVQVDGTVHLHTRSFRYGKLENGCLVTVPPSLVPRRRNHYYTALMDKFEVLFGCNGMIWMQRKLQRDDVDPSATAADSTAADTVSSATSAAAIGSGQQDLHEMQEKRRMEHAAMPYTLEERRDLARLRNAVECLRLTYSPVTPESVEEVYRTSLEICVPLPQMLLPHNAIRLTAKCRPS